LFANIEAILAQIRVNIIHNPNIKKSGVPPTIKWEIAPVNAVNVIIKTLVPTAVFNSYPSTVVRIRNIIIPPPAPINPHIKPISIPHIIDCIILFFLDTACIDSFVVITGFTINLIPSKKVIKTEKFPIIFDGIRLEM